MLEEYDIDNLNPRPNPYVKELKIGTFVNMVKESANQHGLLFLEKFTPAL